MWASCECRLGYSICSSLESRGIGRIKGFRCRILTVEEYLYCIRYDTVRGKTICFPYFK